VSISHHPHDALLLDYSAGNMDEPMSLLVGTHLSLCHECRTLAQGLDALGGALLENSYKPNKNVETLGNIISRRDDYNPLDPIKKLNQPIDGIYLPEPILSYCSNTFVTKKWSLSTPGISYVTLAEEHNKYKFRLYKIRPNTRARTHTHGGQEITQILKGGFTDNTGHYVRGDFVEMGPKNTHQPKTDSGEDCICIVFTDGPQLLTGLLGSFLNPFLSH